MRVIFAGTPEFAAVALAQILAAGHEVALVLTQPDRPAGRGMKLQASAVKQLALQHNIPVAQPLSLRLDGKYPDDAAQAQAAIAAANADVMVVAAYGLILPQWTLSAPRLGCLNIHASLLPRWRGAAPIHRAIEAGDAQTGVVIMQMDAGLDTGDMLLTGVLDIAAQDSTATLHDRLAELGGALVVQALADAQAGQLKPVKQPSEGVTYAHKIEKAEAAVNWRDAASTMDRRVRAFNPFPAAAAQLNGEVIKLWRAVPEASSSAVNVVPGTVLSADAQGVRVACGDGVLCVTELQRAGGKRLAAAEFLRGFPLSAGQQFDLTTA
ncbi:methionyl-tRNA formyltransferase [Limnohabitans sp. TS-CS-82]|uniref:methionyl-tRNA formyltransferase n=1 Tax=Limnohabitans sp. TS-CS-82 TaxID=2094193 RepID=UPI000CF222AE|nr:methionyl-tRNA formyltransferase [Limnohabitans sp. TS-CS-82]PQA83597.1 methionyl-tRNA formyltransferase [Limnohabitans sp. TS-CS-82]